MGSSNSSNGLGVQPLPLVPKTGSSGVGGATPTVPTPEEKVAQWEDGLQYIGLAGRPYMQDLLTELSQGFVSDGVADVAQDVFNELIEHEEWDVFVDVFNTYNDIQTRQWNQRGQTFKSALVLELQPDWAPSRSTPDDMVRAFSKITAHQVRVCVYPYERPGAEPFAPPAAAPEALNICLVALLRTGTKELRLYIPLSSPHAVASAIPGSGLESIRLGNITRLQLTAKAMDSYRTVMESLASCPTLKHLSLGHADLLCLHPVLKRFMQPGGPTLTSVSLKGYPVRDPDDNFVDHTHAFMQQIARFPSLQVFDAKVPLADTLYLRRAILKPLDHHPSLTELHITGGTTFYAVRTCS